MSNLTAARAALSHIDRPAARTVCVADDVQIEDVAALLDEARRVSPTQRVFYGLALMALGYASDAEVQLGALSWRTLSLLDDRQARCLSAAITELWSMSPQS